MELVDEHTNNVPLKTFFLFPKVGSMSTSGIKLGELLQNKQ